MNVIIIVIPISDDKTVIWIRSTNFFAKFQQFKIDVSRDFDSKPMKYNPWNPWRHIIYEFLYFRQKYSVQKRVNRENSKPPGFKPLNHYVRTLFSQKYSLQKRVNRMEWNENIMSGLGGLLGKNLSYPSEMYKEMSILAFARGSFKT